MVPVNQLNIVAIGDEELVSALRLAGVSRYYLMKSDQDSRENVRRILGELMNDPDTGIIVILEDYLEYIEDLLSQARKKKRVTPVIIEVPSKFGTRYKDVAEQYRTIIRESIGFSVEI
ncbi:MAG: V-type ATP synthase subunit F [Chloroflexota bacterium]|nr:V-type ATP synthase subunit F [Chloroflexota bacterium]